MNIFSADHVESELNRFYATETVHTALLEYFGTEFERIDSVLIKIFMTYFNEHQLANEDLFLSLVRKDIEWSDPSYERLKAWMLEKIGTVDRRGILINKKTNYWDLCTIHLKDINSPINNSAGEALENISRHLSKALSINRPFYLLKERFNAILDALNHFHLGVAILDARGSIVLSNSQCKRMLSDSQDLKLSPNGIIKVDEVSIYNHLARLTPTESVVHLMAGGASGEQRFYLQLTRSNFEGLEGSSQYYLLIIVDTEHSSIVNISGLSQIYQLTDSEKLVCQKLIEGCSNNAIADFREVSPETIKTQINSIFRKTGCQNRVQLVNHAHSINIPVDSKG